MYGIIGARFDVIDLATGRQQQIEVGPPPMLEAHGCLGWSVGGTGSGADVEIEARLDGVDLVILRASNHTILAGKFAPDAAIPEIRMRRGEEWVGEPIVREGSLYFRFDGSPLRIGGHEIRVSLFWDEAEERAIGRKVAMLLPGPASPVVQVPPWMVKGMCPRCEHWIYLDDVNALREHCGEPLVQVTEPQQSVWSRLVASFARVVRWLRVSP